MKQIFSLLTKLTLSLIFTLALIELGLRVLPQVLPLPLLIYFAEQPRTEIAQRRNLPTQWGTVVVERDDGGPELRIFKPFTQISLPGHEDFTVTMDQIGFCNPPGSNYQTASFDIMAIGDSFTTCHGVRTHQMWSSQLAQLTGLSVYNLGRGKTGVHEHLQLLKKYGLAKSPRIVIMNIYEGNDLRDAAVFYYYRLHHAQDPATLPESPPDNNGSTVSLLGLLQNYSYTYNLAVAFQKYGAAADLSGTGSAEVVQRTDPFLIAVDALPPQYLADLDKINFKYQLKLTDRTLGLNHKNTDTDEVLMARLLSTHSLDPGVWLAITEALRTFVALSQQYHFVPVVSYTPSAHTAYADSIIFEDPALNELMARFSREQRRFFQKQGEEIGYKFIDLTPALQAAAQENSSQDLLYGRGDLHFTPRGHQVAAETMRQALQELKVLAQTN
jgi:hypothetical protein